MRGALDLFLAQKWIIVTCMVWNVPSWCYRWWWLCVRNLVVLNGGWVGIVGELTGKLKKINIIW